MAEKIVTWQAFLATQETFPQIVARKAATEPNNVFAISAADGAEYTWSQLEQHGLEWAARFNALGIGRGDVVATFLDASLISLSLWLGLTKIGAIDASINVEFKGRMLVHAITNCTPKAIVAFQRHLSTLETVAEDIRSVKTVLIADAERRPSGTSTLSGLVSLEDVPCRIADVEKIRTIPNWWDVACITYTSGTTGPSKAVVLPWGQVHSVSRRSFPIEDLGEQDVLYTTTTHAHFASKAMPYMAAMAGGRVIIRPRFSLSNFWSDIERYGITTASMVGTVGEMLARSEDGPKGKSSLRNVFMAPMGNAYRKFNERFGTRVCTAYNSTEGGLPIASEWDPGNDRTAGRLRQGFPGFNVRIVDENDYEVPLGTIGELIVRPLVPWTMSLGYHNDPAATVRAWRNGWFHTGDAFLQTTEGEFILVDRMKDVIRRRGENISSFEVETDVMSHPDVVECAAVAAQSELAEDEILLFVVVEPGCSLTPPSLHSYLESRMPRFMLPRYIEFVDNFPKTEATVRIMKTELRRRGIGPKTWDRERESVSGRVSK